MPHFFKNMSGKQKLLGFLFLTAVMAVLLTLFTGDFTQTIVVSIVICVIMWFTKMIWLPEDYGRNFIRRISLYTALAAVASYSLWQSFLVDLCKQFVESMFPGAMRFPVTQAPPAIAFAFLLIVIWIVNYFTRDKTGMGIHQYPISKDIPKPDFKSRFKQVCEALRDDLRSIDIQTKWSTQNFTPLDAEVEVYTTSGVNKKVADLLKSIRSSSDRLFLVLGDPGSGKSVALRKLCQDLLDEEASKTGKLPIYINLKEWSVEKKWDDENPVNVQQLQDFVLANIKGRDIITSKFFDKYFDRLYETGRLYFVFDSFDEIPAVLDEKDNSDLIKHLSDVIFRFLKGARQKESQGILASRFFRKPTHEFQTNTRLEIRPFTEEKIIKTLKRSSGYKEELVRGLFKERLELVPIARNPFSASLIAEFMESHDHLPENQLELYEDYIHRTLDSCADRIQKRNLTKDGIISCSIAIADEMFTKYGLEAPINELRKKITDYSVDDVIDVLTFARIGRFGTGDKNQFTFVHRRFCEYFAIQTLIQDDTNIDLESIPTDSQWRDALVLYCEVAEESKASEIAEFCWKTINDADNPMDLRSVHCMRFLRDAFKGRLECLGSFRKKLGQYILNLIDKKNNMVSVKLAVETLGLLETEEIDNGVIKAMELGNSWINETAFRACRHLAKISSGLENKLIQHINQINEFFFFRKRKELSFSLSLSEGFAKINTFFKWKKLDLFLLILALFFSFLIYPVTVASLLIIIFFFASMFAGLNIMQLVIKRDSAPITIMRCYFALVFLGQLYLDVLLSSIPDRSIGYEYKISFMSQLDHDIILLFKLIGDIVGDIMSFRFVNVAELHWIIILMLTLLFILYIPLYKIRFLTLFYFVSLRTLLIENIKKIILYIAFSLLILLLMVVFDKLLQIGLYWSVVMTVLMIISVLFRYSKRLVGYIAYKKINFTKCNDREYIYNHLKQNEQNICFKMHFIRYLENNVKEVTGEWPDDILQVSNKDSVIRLAKLEEKWLGLDR